MRRRASREWRRWLWCAAASAGLGCEAPSFVPPPSPPPLPPVSPGPVASKGLVFLAPADANAKGPAWEQAARQEAGRLKLAFRGDRTDASRSQAEALRSAVEKGAAGVIVLADDPEALAPAAAEALDKGVAVVQLFRPIPGLSGKTTLVEAPDLDDLARRIVAATIEDARKFGFEDGAPAAVVAREPGDEFTADRVEALRKAAREAGIGTIVDITYRGGVNDCRDAVLEALASEPGLAIFLADEDDGLRGIAEARVAVEPPSRYVSGGFCFHDESTAMFDLGHASALAGVELARQAVRAARAAADLVEGRDVASRLESDAPFWRGEGKEPQRRRNPGEPPPGLGASNRAREVRPPAPTEPE